MAKDSGSGKNIYGDIPDAGVDSVVKQAMGSLDDSFSNKINGPVKSKDTDYPEQKE